MPPKAQIRLPGIDERTAVIGRTGSGKTVLAMWLLSKQPIASMPWIIIDYKGDELINGVERAYDLSFDDKLPKEPGIYIVRVRPGQEEELSNLFKRIWDRGHIGIFIDEGYMIGQRDNWFNACLTQGRSKHIPMIVLTQRPLWLSRFVFSESSFFFIFDLTDDDDIRVVKRFVKSDNKNTVGLEMPPHHSNYYDVGNRALARLGPVPPPEKILEAIDAKLPKKRNRAL